MTRMTPSEAFVETLAANGVTTMFGIMGSAFMDAMDIFAPAGMGHVSSAQFSPLRTCYKRGCLFGMV